MICEVVQQKFADVSEERIPPACRLLLAAVLRGLLFGREDRSTTLLRNVSGVLPEDSILQSNLPSFRRNLLFPCSGQEMEAGGFSYTASHPGAMRT
jgi:hypothetical protein